MFYGVTLFKSTVCVEDNHHGIRTLHQPRRYYIIRRYGTCVRQNKPYKGHSVRFGSEVSPERSGKELAFHDTNILPHRTEHKDLYDILRVA